MKTFRLPLRNAGPLFVCLTLLSCQQAAESEPIRPLRVVRVGHADLAAMRAGIGQMWALCKLGKGQLESSIPPLPPDNFLQQFKAEETEELFTPQRWATFRTVRSILPDHDRDCKLTVYVERSAEIEHACHTSMSGRTTTIDEALNHGAPPRHQVHQSQQSCEAKGEYTADDLTGLPREIAANAHCVWHSKILERVSITTGLQASEEGTYRGWDFCMYDRLTKYPLGDGYRSVVLKSRKLDLNSMAGTPLPELLRAHMVFSTQAVSFSDGDPIAPERFSRTALESFLKQPTKLQIEALR